VANEVVFDAVAQEIDVATGLVLFQWDSLDHVPLVAGYTPIPNQPKKGQTVKPNGTWDPYDYFHVNSVGIDTDGNLLISARNTWAVYKIDHQTGGIIWTLGGKYSSFRLGPGAAFAFQHDVRARAANDRIISMFDDGAGPPYVHSQSRVLTLQLNLRHRTATVLTQRDHSPPLLSSYEGDAQELPDQDEFVGWGQQPYFSQYDPQGKLVFEGRFVDANISYRAYRFAWNGTPSTPPSVVSTRRGRTMNVLVSWNGATGVATWRVFAGKTASALRLVATVPRRGFETAINVRARPYVAVQALGYKGRSLRWSNVSRVP
jgi:hypothetical protein